MKRLLLSAITILVATTLFQSCKNDPEAPVPVVQVQGLFDQTGSWSSLGITSKAALDIAVEDINSYLANKNANFRMTATVTDTKLDATRAATLFTKAVSDSVRFIIGPQSSAELAAIKPLSDASKIIVVSQSSTAGSLAVANDAIFRFCPGDKIEGAALANTIFKKGFKGLVTIARDDAGNKGLQTATGAAFSAKGGQTIALDPYATTLTDYSALIATLKTKVNTLTAAHSTAEVGVYLASFDEGIEIFKLAAADPVLSNIKWFGGDGVALSTAFLNDPVVAAFAIKTEFFAPSFGLPLAFENKWKPIAARIKAKTNREPDAFALVAYDAMWTIAYTIEANKGITTDFEKNKSVFVDQANKNTGIVGVATLDAAGDRANGTFDYFGIIKQGSSYVWTLVGKSE